MKFAQKNKMELGDTLVPDLFILNNMANLGELDVKLYIYMLFLSKMGKETDKADLAKKLNVTEQDIGFAIERLQGEDLITRTTAGYNIVDLKDVEINKSYIPKVEPRKTHAQTEKERKRMAATSAINESFFQGIMSLSWYTDIGSMFENYSFSEEVMIALFHYCQERKALNKKYVHAVAETWYKGGVKSFEDLEDFLENYDNIQKIKQKIAKSLRLNRNFTKYEEQYIDTGTGFCSDRNMASGDSYTDSSFGYAPRDRTNNGSLQCNDLDILSQDNGKIPNPIGLLTSDEYVLAGSEDSYLNTETFYWTMSPAVYNIVYNIGYASVLFVDQSGNRNNDLVAGVLGVRPVINLRSDVALSGSGTSTDPFKVVGA